MSGAAPSAGPLRRLFRSTSLYALSNLLQRGAGFLLVPLYARHFTTAEFGAMDQVYQGALILILLTSLGLPQGLVRGIHLETKTEEERARLVGALVALLVPVVLAVAALLVAGRGALARLLFRDAGEPAWIALGAAFYLALSLHQMPLELLKVRQKAAHYVAWSLVTFVLLVAGNLVLVLQRGMGLRGMLIAGSVAYGSVGIVLWARTAGAVRLNLEFRRLAPLFAFGLPMLPGLASRKVLEVADRYMIPWYHDLDTLGIYVMGAKVAAIVEALVLVPFLYAWQPFFYAAADDPAAPRTFARVTHAMALALAGLFLAVTAARGVILDLLGAGRFAAAGPIVTVLVLAVVCNGLQYCVSAGIHIRRRLVQEMLVMVGAAVVNLGLNVILIPPFAGMGAAAATLAAYAFYLGGTFLLARRIYPVPYAWGRLANIAAQTAVAAALMACTEALAPRLLVVGAWIATCPVADLARHGELRALFARGGTDGAPADRGAGGP